MKSGWKHESENRWYFYIDGERKACVMKDTYFGRDRYKVSGTPYLGDWPLTLKVAQIEAEETIRRVEEYIKKKRIGG